MSMFKFFRVDTVSGIVADIRDKVERLNVIRDRKTQEADELTIARELARDEAFNANRIAGKLNGLIS